MTACKISLTACLPIDIQFSGQTACLIIKCIFIIRITDTRIPQDHRWMIAILHHHFTDISQLCPPVTYIPLCAVSHSVNRFGIPFLKKLLNSAKIFLHKRKFSTKISPEYISQELQSLPNRAMIGKTILARYAAGQPLPAHRMVNSNRLTPEKERVRL